MTTTQPEVFTVRPIESDDTPFLEQMAYLATYSINGTIATNAPPIEVVRQRTSFQACTADWGREGDYGLIAIDDSGQQLGGIWYRNYEDERLPERLVALAVEPAHQTRKGVGTFLLKTLLDHARDQGIQDIYLTVDVGNKRARALYEKLGFTILKEYNSLDVLQISTETT